MTAMATVPAQEVERARVALRDAAHALTTAQVVDVELDDGGRREVVVPALLSSLASEITDQSAPSGSFAPRSRPPLWLDAVALLDEIDRTAGASEHTRCQDVHAWARAWSSRATGAELVAISRTVEGWLASVTELLNPTPRRHVRGVPCPACGAVKVWDREDRDNDEHHARPALRIDDQQAACVCDVCGARWGVELFAHLQMVLEHEQVIREQQRAETLAVESWDGRLDLPERPVQCDGRVRDWSDEEHYRTRRCERLLDSQGRCPGADRHEES